MTQIASAEPETGMEAHRELSGVTAGLERVVLHDFDLEAEPGFQEDADHASNSAFLWVKLALALAAAGRHEEALETCDRVNVMYSGQVVEEGTVDEVFDHMRHPYTKGLFSAIPLPGADKTARPLVPIRGQLPLPHERPQGCC